MNSTPKNIISVFFETAGRRAYHVCARFKEGNEWQTVNWREFADRVLTAAVELGRKGLRHGDRVVIFARTQVEWTLMDLAVLAVGGVSVPVYASLPEERVDAIIANAEPVLIFSDKENTLAGFFKDLPPASDEEKAAILEIADGLDPSDEATIVYTSGTTGIEKGAVITHGNILAEIRALQKDFDIDPSETGLICLPLAHVLGRVMQLYHLAQGVTTAYAESIEKLAQNYLEVKPHFVCGVPRMLEKIHELVELRVAKASFIERFIFKTALAIGFCRSRRIEEHRPIPIYLRAGFLLANRLVLSRIRSALGGRLNLFICGGAALREDIARFFHAAGILVIEGYGLTETFAAATVNRMDNFRFGSVGKSLSGVEMRLAPDGEVLFRGPTIFKEYRGMQKETEAAFDRNGWFLTGDIGELTGEGFLKITGRKKEIIITAGGKNIAPQMIESLMSASPYISFFMVYGDGRKYLTALVAVTEEAARYPAARELIARHIEEQNKKLAPFETIKKFAIVDGDFTIAKGELTPTLKVRRRFVAEKYRDVLEGMYE